MKTKFRSAFEKFRGSALEIDLAPYWRTVSSIHKYHVTHHLDAISDEEILGQFTSLRETRSSGGNEVAAFALVFEAAKRALDLTPHNVQLIAGLAMCGRRIAELPTGEGKTLAAVFPASLAALSGRGVHVLTFNDYLARRDAGWMGPVYKRLGLTVGFIQEGMDRAAKREAYLRDITYATAKEAGFDFLRDQLVEDAGEKVQRGLDTAIVDEADSILIDEARIPLVISGLAGRLDRGAAEIAAVVKSLTPGRDYRTDAEKRNVYLTDEGVTAVERRLGRANLYAAENETLLTAVHCALHAEALVRRDKDYIVRNGRVEIVDEFTGRVMDKRHWPDGLQAAVEAKENVVRKSEGRILGSITLQHFFGLYENLSGMTATAAPSAEELREFYGVTVTVVPPHVPCVREDLPDEVFLRRATKRRRLVDEIRAVHATGQPILVGTASVEESEELAAALAGAGVSCAVLNARNDELEAGIIAGAGRPGAVTISTNMAGRGTDVALGGPAGEERDAVVRLGGLYVIGTNRHESLRIDHQLRGRSGRQGDPGSSKFFISLDDDIFERYGLRDAFVARHHLGGRPDAADPLAGMQSPSPVIRREIIHAQRVIEGQNFDIRKTLAKYSTMIETQRRIIQVMREDCLSGPTDASANGDGSDRGGWLPIDGTLAARGEAKWGCRPFHDLTKRLSLFHLDRAWSDHLAWLNDLRESIHLVALGGKEPVNEFMKAATQAFDGIEERVENAVNGSLARLLEREGPIDLEAEGLKGPSSTWTYLVNDDQFGWGIEMLKGKNLGFAVSAAAVFGPLYILSLVVDRLFRRTRRAR